MSQDRIGFIGVGIMGGAMVRHLAAASFEVTAFDRSGPAVDRIIAEYPQVRKAASVGELARQSDVVITMLPSGREVMSVALDADGLRDNLKPGAMLLDTSSAAPWHTKQTAAALAEKGIAMVDAPVSGAEVGAKTAELVFMVGGTDEDVARARPLLELMGKAIFHLGPLGSGDVMKAMNNLITAVTLTTTNEALLVGTRAGLDPAIMNDVLDISTGGSWVSRTHYRSRVFNRAFDDTFTFDLMLKDMNIAGRIADELEMPMQVSNQARTLWTRLQGDLPQHSPISRLSYAMEQQAGVELISKSQPPAEAPAASGALPSDGADARS